ncbi:RNA chaperone/anti-terminator [Kingella potus]|uniref:RNA chaperone/anti-terminator n=1 Tax=Kingella potus TaxID=265175 RepID=A0A377R4S7_9NEIS|nr:DUF1294 domain-containing protein [Kingella potus]UOP00633.1 DUF1294 domain-containing protein [Kingella potus]STR02982.1 RNA chaperone/anti-terminator [Kingella potus]
MDKQTGTVARWHDDKGYGFIRCDDNGREVFFHISQFRADRRPECGDRVAFALAERQGKTQAVSVQELAFVQRKAMARKRQEKQRQQQQQAFASGRSSQATVVAALYAGVAVLCAAGRLPWLLFAWYIVAGIITFAAYYSDKQAAQAGEWRIKEDTLHMLALLGGWGGALLAQAYMRHKSQKASFRSVFYATVFFNTAALLYLATRPAWFAVLWR